MGSYFVNAVLLGATTLVKFAQKELIVFFINMIFGLPLTYAYVMLRQSVAGMLTFWGIYLKFA